MKGRIVMFVVLTAVIVPAAARADVTTAGRAEQYAGASWYQPNANGYRGGFVTVVASYGEDSSGASVTPAVAYQASGMVWVCEPSCTFTPYPVTVVNPTALTMDPVGNTARMQFSLTSASPPLVVDITMTRPRQFSFSPSNALPNFWVDPGSGEAEVSLSFAGVFLQRMGYTLAGTINGDPLIQNAQTSGYSGTNAYAQSVVINVP